jgi:hypothetical protein
MPMPSPDTTTLGAIDPRNELSESLRKIEVPVQFFANCYELLPAIDLDMFEGFVVFAHFGVGVAGMGLASQEVFEIHTMPKLRGNRRIVCKDLAVFVEVARRLQFWQTTKTVEWSEIAYDQVWPDLLDRFGDNLVGTFWSDLISDMDMDSFDTIHPHRVSPFSE